MENSADAQVNDYKGDPREIHYVSILRASRTEMDIIKIPTHKDPYPKADRYIYNNVFAFLNDKHWELDRISGIFRHVLVMAKHPTVHVYERLLHIPDQEGAKSAVYQAIAEELEDDHLTDMTDCVEIYCNIALFLGYTDSWRPAVSPVGNTFYLGELEN